MRRMLWCVLATLAGTAGAAAGQQGPAGGPMTYALARKANYVPLETLRETRSRIPAPLARRVTIERDGVLLQQVLLDIANQAELGLSYGEDLVRARVVISLSAKNETAADALQQVTDGTDWAVLVTPAGQVAVLRREPAQVGAIVGNVTDAKTGTALGGATVVVEGTSLSTMAGSDGHYRIADVTPGTYTVRARFIGYAPGAVSVTVSADQEATADLALEKSAQQLNEVVTTGTVVPTEVKALPTPITVITAEEIALQRPHTVGELFRQFVPGAVSWNISPDPWQTTFSARGATTLSPNGTGQMKVLVDGIETSSPTAAAVDPASVERVEVIRGPQAGAIYGSDAIGGVIQVFTKRGDASSSRPRIGAETAFGLVQTPYAGYGGVLRQEYKASVRGGSPDVTYNLGGGYSRSGNWLPNGETSAQSNPSAFGGVHFVRGVVVADVSARYYENNTALVFNPELFGSGFSTYSKANYRTRQIQNQTVGMRFSVAPAAWWQATVTAGIDRAAFNIVQTQRRLTVPSDTLLQLSEQSRPKKFVGINASLQGSLASGLSGSLTAGFDHYDLLLAQFFTSNALNTTGAIQVPAGASVSALRIIMRNTGYFAQGQLSLGEALFLTGGLRADQNTEFGDSLSTPVSPRVGLSYLHRIARTTLKLRSSYGRAIRPPSPGQKLAGVGSSSVQVANSALAPERQRGWDAGFDAAFGSRGSLSITYYNQIADNLIQNVLLGATPTQTFQNQNVGRVKNTGIELESSLSLGPLQVSANYGYARSRIDNLAIGYTGDLVVGDQSRFTPKHTAGASLAFFPLKGTVVAGGLTYVGSWTATDWLSYFRCIGGTGPCRNATFALNRDYIITYPSVVKVNASISQQLTPVVSAFASVDNITNSQAYELWNFNPVMGRISTVGLRLAH